MRLQHIVPAAIATAVALALAASAAEPVIIDHSCTDLTRVPVNSLKKARSIFGVAYGHTSHGSQIVAGMEALAKAEPAVFAFGREGGRGRLSFWDGIPEGDLGNPDRGTWAERTRNFLRNEGRDRNLVMWSWCGQVSSASAQDIKGYLDLMNGLEKEFPRVKFVYMTGHLDGSGKNGNLNRRNEQIREFCKRRGKILFDFADLESYDPDGKVNFMERNATDACDYVAGGGRRKNWADDWLARHPRSGIALPDNAAHTRPLNGALKGRAFWWMLARLAGWNPSPQPGLPNPPRRPAQPAADDADF
ncbi:MAG: hypothetical protein WC708_16835 [Lentisphaeria bacterium]